MPAIKVVQVTILRHWDPASQTTWYEPRVFFYGSTEANRKISCDADATSIDEFVKSAVCAKSSAEPPCNTTGVKNDEVQND